MVTEALTYGKNNSAPPPEIMHHSLMGFYSGTCEFTWLEIPSTELSKIPLFHQQNRPLQIRRLLLGVILFIRIVENLCIRIYTVEDNISLH